jgi:hypothetical protein
MEYGFFCGMKPLGRRSKAKRVLEKSAKAERERGNSFSTAGEEESSEGKNP